MIPDSPLVFDESYYQRVIQEFGYDPLRFGDIDFTLGNVRADELRARWICHSEGREFAQAIESSRPSIVISGVGLSSVPHIGTLSQILNILFLQERGIATEFVLGDLDAHNGKNLPLSSTRELAEKYKKFITALGFKSQDGSLLRDQFSHPEITRTMYLCGHYMDDGEFDNTEEDLHALYVGHGKTDDHMSFRRKLSLALMVADFIDLLMSRGFTNVLVTLGIDEHRYVLFAQEVLKKMRRDGLLIGTHIGAMYSPLIAGFNNYPKMSKSFPESSINLGMTSDEIRTRVLEQEGTVGDPLLSPVYQMMLTTGGLSLEDLKERYNAAKEGGKAWNQYKTQYLEHLISLKDLWQRV